LIEVCGAPFHVVSSEAGLIRLVLPEMSEKIRNVAGATRPRVIIDDTSLHEETVRHVHETGRFLAELLSGRKPSLLPQVDNVGLTGFTGTVLGIVRQVPWGSVRSYGEVAISAGVPRGARAIGGAVGRNPVPLVIPCHRIIKSDGSVGGWSGKTGWKEWLLGLEGFRAIEQAGIFIDAEVLPR
jgi:methylated-DNA-[protein]-cysteine S-methyltransferase